MCVTLLHLYFQISMVFFVVMSPDQKHTKGGKEKQPKHEQPMSFWMQVGIVFLMMMLLLAGYGVISEQLGKSSESVPLSQIAADVTAGTVKTITVSGDDINAVYKDDTTKTSKKESEASLSETLYNYGVKPADLATVSLEIKEPGGFRYWFLTLLPILLPIILLFGLIWYFSRQVRGMGMQAFTFGQSRARLSLDDGPEKITFADVAGAKEAKVELTEIVDFLKNPAKFLAIGARIPKGVMLMGAPGTGKTLLARAVAGEAGVPFFSISGSEFVEMFVGVGASRVRDLFLTAKKQAPAIVFIDEIDAVGRVRGTGVGGGNDEREQTLNQILVELDGFEPSEKVIVMAGTNCPAGHYPALFRPCPFY